MISTARLLHGGGRRLDVRPVGRSVSGAPEEGAHGKAALLIDVAVDGEAVVGEEAVELPLGHGLVVVPGVPRVVQRHLEAARASAPRALLLPVPVPRRRPALARRPCAGRRRRRKKKKEEEEERKRKKEEEERRKKKTKEKQKKNKKKEEKRKKEEKKKKEENNRRKKERRKKRKKKKRKKKERRKNMFWNSLIFFCFDEFFCV